ncbi:MAG: CCA tRNA nucleotidyltransferase [Armatimonadetes bacterium]|nr:MAG: CCA tRNA nucleotidyltransferase [Armatimonadota bacterium]
MKISLPEEVQIILNKFTEAGYQIYIVGGAVRDLLMNRQVNDWDFTTDAKPEDILKLFPEGFYDNKFGTVGIPISNVRGDEEEAKTGGAQERSRASTAGSRLRPEDAPEIPERQDPSYELTEPTGEIQIFEITTMRKEGEYEDFRHPEQIIWTDKIEEDLARRDFTINAMALKKESRVQSLESGKKALLTLDPSDLTLIDPFRGQDDLKNKLIKAVGDPDKRFQEDALRLMRAIRIATQLEFDIESDTLKAIKRNASLITQVSYERIRDELFKLLASVNPYMGIVQLREAGILQIILPEVEATFGVMQAGPKHVRVYDIGEHSLQTLKHTPSSDPLVRFAALLHDIGKTATMKVDETGNVTFYHHEAVGGRIVLNTAKRFNLSKKQTDKLYRLVRWHLFTVDENQTDSAIRRFIRNVEVENIDDMIALRIGDRIGGGTQKAVSWRMEKFRERINQVLQKPFSVTDLKVNGKDVMEVLDITPGPKVGKVLNTLFEEVLEDSTKNTREHLLERIKEVGNN